MIVFKDKIKKKCPHPVNIDNKHCEIVKSFESQTKSIHELKEQLCNCINEYTQLSNIDNNIISDEQLERKFELKFKIDEIEKKIVYIEQQNNPVQYFVHTGHILFQYYNKVNVIDQAPLEVANKNPLSNPKILYPTITSGSVSTIN